MKQHVINLYDFTELSESAKEKALKRCHDINVVYEWWDYAYDDAKNIGLKITSFDIYRRNITGELLFDIKDVVRAIQENHGKSCDTYDLVRSYYYNKWLKKHSKTTYDFDENEFLHDLLECYLAMLSKQYDFLTSEEAIIETILLNEYDFTEDGKLF